VGLLVGLARIGQGNLPSPSEKSNRQSADALLDFHHDILAGPDRRQGDNVRKISAGFVLGLGLILASATTPAAAQEKIKIGAMVSLTGGAVSVVGEDMRRGFTMAIEEANAKGGYRGKKFEMVVGDDQANPTVGVGLAQRLLVRDNVAAIVGLASSTVIKAVGSIAAQHKKPMFAVGGSSPLVEEAYGREPWFFHFIPWEYARAETAVAVLKGLQPAPKNVAIAYENGVYGSGSAPLLKEQLEANGFKVVAYESFQAGSPSLLPLLSRVKSVSPDVFFAVAFPTDHMLLVKQSREIDFSPKLLWLPELFTKEEYGGTPSDYFSGFGTWISASPYPEAKRWITDFRKLYPDRQEPLDWAPMSYTAMKMMLNAIADVGPETEALTRRLEREKTDSPFGQVSFHDSKNGRHQALMQYSLVQLQNGKKTIVFPPELAGAKIMYPMPDSKDRVK
jgi:branched-chain amino acid transport system substrate-binding protein